MEMKVGITKQEIIAVYNKFLQSGRPLNKSEHPDLDKQEFTTFIKFLFPIFSLNEAIPLYY